MIKIVHLYLMLLPEWSWPDKLPSNAGLEAAMSG